jgi:hypothetical protein
MTSDGGLTRSAANARRAASSSLVVELVDDGRAVFVPARTFQTRSGEADEAEARQRANGCAPGQLVLRTQKLRFRASQRPRAIVRSTSASRLSWAGLASLLGGIGIALPCANKELMQCSIWLFDYVIDPHQH